MTLASTERPALAATPPARRHRRSALLAGLCLLLGTFLGAAGGAAATTLVTPRSVVDVKVLIRPLPGNAFSSRVGDTLVDLKTESQLPRSDRVLERIAPPVTGRPPIQDLRRRLGIRLIDNADVIVISARGRTPALALSFAEDVSAATLAVRRERAIAAYAVRAGLLESEITAAEDDMRVALASVAPSEEVAVLSRRLVALRSELRSATTANRVAGAVIGTSAARQPRARQLNLAITGTGAAAGVAFGLLVARRVRRADDGGGWIRAGRRR